MTRLEAAGDKDEETKEEGRRERSGGERLLLSYSRRSTISTFNIILPALV